MTYYYMYLGMWEKDECDGLCGQTRRRLAMPFNLYPGRLSDRLYSKDPQTGAASLALPRFAMPRVVLSAGLLFPPPAALQ